jgi:hypothetical protein
MRETRSIFGGAGFGGGGQRKERSQLRHSIASSRCGLPQYEQFFIPNPFENWFAQVFAWHLSEKPEFGGGEEFWP